MAHPEVLFFDVLGTVTDWRGSIAAEAAPFLDRYNATHIDAGAFADDWVGRYDAAVDAVRKGDRAFATLDTLNRENLNASLAAFGLMPSGVAKADLDNLNQAWHRLKPWPDALEALRRLKTRFVIAPLSDGHTRLLVDMAKQAGLPWDTVLGADIFQAYKPMPEVYLKACSLMGVAPQNAMLVAAHAYDLSAARACGLMTAFIRRENAGDPSKPAGSGSRENWDYTAGDLIALAEALEKADRIKPGAV